jgi:disulfide oxidoreductase YuzD
LVSYDKDDKENLGFYEQAAKEIYEWLSIEKKDKLANELFSMELSNINDLDPRERFFMLMNFLEVNYVKPLEWAKEAIEILARSQEPTQNEVQHASNYQKDAIIGSNKAKTIELEHEVNLNVLVEKTSTFWLREEFNSTLEKLGLNQAYKQLLETKRGKKVYE